MIGHNGINDPEAQLWLSEIMRVHADLEIQKVENMNRSRQIRERLPEIYDRAKDAGIPVKALKAAVKVILKQRDLDELIAKVTPEDDDDAEAFDFFRSIPKQGDLFSASEDDDGDLRPGFLKNKSRGLPGADAAEA